MDTKTSDLIAMLMPDLAKLSDEEWAARDRRVAEEQFRRDEERRRKQGEQDSAILIANGLSPRHLGIGTYQTPALDAVTRLPPGIWVLSGNAGCGKTTAAHAWLLVPWADVRPSAHQLMLVTSQEFARTSRYEGKIERCADPARLVVDDLGVEYLDQRGSFLSDLDELIDLRWRREHPTLITTNLDAGEFKARYGLRLESRIRDEGGWLNVGGPDLRGGRRS